MKADLHQVLQQGKRRQGPGGGGEGFSLIELVIAIAVVALTFIGVIGLLGTGLATDQASTQQTVATNIAASILADLRSTPGNLAGTGTLTGKFSIQSNTTQFTIPMPTTDTTSSPPLKGATPVVLYFSSAPLFIQTGATVPSTAAYVANVYLVQLSHVGNGNGATGLSQYNDLARVVVSWPAQGAGGTTPAGSVDIISQFLVH